MRVYVSSLYAYAHALSLAALFVILYHRCSYIYIKTFGKSTLYNLTMSV